MRWTEPAALPSMLMAGAVAEPQSQEVIGASGWKANRLWGCWGRLGCHGIQGGKKTPGFVRCALISS